MPLKIQSSPAAQRHQRLPPHWNHAACGGEFRSRPTKRIGERFYTYASQQRAEGKLFLEGSRAKPEIRVPKQAIMGGSIEVPGSGPEPWMLQLAKMLILKDLPTGVIVGTASIEEKVTGPSTDEGSLYEWDPAGVERAKPKGQPQPVWFTPF